MFYGDEAGIDVYEKAREYYDLFYGYTIQPGDLAKYSI